MKVRQSDQEIVSGCQKGDKEAFRALFGKHHPWMMGICMRYCRDRNDAKDVLQECMIKIFNHIGGFTYQADAQFVAWLKRIVVNTSLNFIRQQSKEAWDSIDENQPIVFADESDDYSETSGWSEEKLLGLINQLPAGYRAVFNMYVFEQMTHKEIAQELGISENTSKTQLMKARTFLKTKISNTVKSIAI